MADNIPDPSEFFQIPKDLLTAQQKFLPSGRFFEQFAEQMRNITQAQIAYSQALMRANAALLATILERPAPQAPAKEERPSVAARHAEYVQS